MSEQPLISYPADGIAVMEFTGRDLAAEALDANGRQRVLPAAFYANTKMAERAFLCVQHGIYGLVTWELVHWLEEQIDGRMSIEIGSGDGVLASALGIPATDNKLQLQPAMRAHYEQWQQAIVNYGDDVEEIDGGAAVDKYRPEVIVASWLTHRYRDEQPERGGNPFAPDERYLLDNCGRLIFIGNTSAHAKHPLLELPHEKFRFHWLYSRAVRGENFIGVWHGGK